MNKREKIQTIRDLSAGKIMEPVKLCYIEAENGKDLQIIGEFTPEQKKLIESGKVETIEDLSKLSDEMLRRLDNGYLPKVYFAK